MAAAEGDIAMKNTSEALLSFIEKGTSPFQVVDASAKELETAGFQELDSRAEWKLKVGGKYFLKVYGSTLLAFRIGKKNQTGLRIAAAHTDFPCFRVKPNPLMGESYGQLNVEPYGGMILSSWLDRPLSLAGHVVLRGENPFSPETVAVDFKRPILTIPSLAIHMNRKVNEGVELNRQTEMLPLFSMAPEGGFSENCFVEFLAKEINRAADDILSWELSIYPTEKGCTLGMENDIISSPRLDNLTSVQACLKGLIDVKNPPVGTEIIALFDNEEVGSRTKQGADSAVLTELLERIYKCRGLDKEQLYRDMAEGFMLSVDVAHAMHPAHKDKADPTNRPILNGGVVLKQAASQAYAGDAEAVAVISELCNVHDIPYQTFVNHNNIRGGSTLGSMASALVPMRAMDIGVPILSMHSARETMGAKDQEALEKLLKAFFES